MSKFRNIATVGLSAAFIFGFSIWSIAKPATDMSQSERRKLTQFPELTLETVTDGSFMTDFEKYTLDQFPLRDKFRTLKSVTALYAMGKKDNNGIYLYDGYASKLEYPYNPSSIKWAASRMNFVYEKYLKPTGSKVYLSVVPDKNYFIAEKGGYLYMDYESLFRDLLDQTDFAEYIDITGQLGITDYYKTDTHWRQEKISSVANYIAAAMGTTINPTYTQVDVGVPFYGVYYGQSALPLSAEKIYYLTNETLKNCKVFDYESNAYMDMYDM